MEHTKNFSAAARRNCQHLYGCSPEEALALNEGFALGRKGSPIERYRQQRWMAEKRDIAWEFTFPEWKRLWDESGKWSQRGTGAGEYYMARRGDAGPYNVDNCFIACNNGGYVPVSQEAKDNRFAKRLGCALTDFDSADQMRVAARKFSEQRRSADQRGIEWKLTFAEWWGIWKESGRWESRGNSRSTSAVMARTGDIGPYSKDNVRIATLAENFAEAWVTCPKRDTHPRKSA